MRAGPGVRPRRVRPAQGASAPGPAQVGEIVAIVGGATRAAKFLVTGIRTLSI
jgi:hypothetical protein